MRTLSCLFLIALLAAAAFAANPPRRAFVRVHGMRFEVNGVPYRFIGTNFWIGMNLGAHDRPRLIRELDRLQALGVTNLRVIGGSEGPDSAPWRVVPALQVSPGVYDEDLFQGLDFLLAEMGRRDMRAVVCLNNFWPWSGGMAQYVQWASGVPIPYPPPQEGGSWSEFQKYASRFYLDTKALSINHGAVTTIVGRVNSITGQKYSEDPTIMAWELANEPRGDAHPEALERWIEKTSRLIKSLDANHLVTTGSEGQTPWPGSAGLDVVRNHCYPSIDYVTAHIWPQNWGWFDPKRAADTYPSAMEKVTTYFNEHVSRARRLGKPIVFEEFGLARDDGSFEPTARALLRDKFYTDLFQLALVAAEKGAPVGGVNFWAWSGEARPREPGGLWKAGDPLTGDPPHEQQGWYSVYDTDKTTLAVIGNAAKKMSALK